MSEFMKEMFGESINEGSEYPVKMSKTKTGWSITIGSSRFPDYVYKWDKKEGQFEVVKDNGIKKKPKLYYYGSTDADIEKKAKEIVAKLAKDGKNATLVKESIEQIDEARMSIDSDNYKVTVDYDEDKGATFKVGSKVVAELKGTGNMKATIKDPVLLLDALMDIINSN